jgi:endonuclease/exonuclease/phosphatase (EEP) superfamily protein YafD
MTMKILFITLKALVVFYLLSSLIPLLKVNQWYVRVWDFPRLQLLFFGFLAILVVIIFDSIEVKIKLAYGLIFLIGAGIDLYRILPYSKIWSKETLSVETSHPRQKELKIMTVNVLQDNTEYGKLIDLIKNKDPDLILLVEVDEKWIKNLSPIENKYQLTLKEPLSNTYGMAFYSKLDAEYKEIRFLIEKEVPSIFVRLRLPSGELFELHGLHPKPPQIETKTTTNRDAELVTVAKAAAKSKLPTIVLGDLNDVAWSHTTRLFRRISGLLDPRVGRGTYATFPAGVPFFHFPLDYVFSSEEWLLKKIEVLPNIGSDHYPVFISLLFNRSAQAQQEGPKKEKGDEKEAKKTIEKAK